MDNGPWTASRNRSSAIQPQDLAREVGAFAHEEVDCVGDVLRCAGSVEGDALEVFLFFGFGVVGRPVDYAGGDAVDGDVGGEGSGEAEREVPEGGLAGAVGEVLRPGALGEEVDHVDDVAFCGAEHWLELLGEE